MPPTWRDFDRELSYLPPAEQRRVEDLLAVLPQLDGWALLVVALRVLERLIAEGGAIEARLFCTLAPAAQILTVSRGGVLRTPLPAAWGRPDRPQRRAGDPWPVDPLPHAGGESAGGESAKDSAR